MKGRGSTIHVREGRDGGREQRKIRVVIQEKHEERKSISLMGPIISQSPLRLRIDRKSRRLGNHVIFK